MMVNGNMINNMDMVKKVGLMKLNMKGNIKTERKMEMESLLGQIILAMKENFLKIILKVRAFILGRMDVNIRDSGRIIKCMVKVNLLGVMEKNMLVRNLL